GAIMVEPTETEPKENLDQLVDALISIAAEAAEKPERLRKAPVNPKVRRLDETTAARKPCLAG
ncbi:MAG: aminomethyl-transferring glycine dehydrogenase subunit GcvPB, partial [Deltaproteobacteria bacterium]|nr:aminomethyl-transferring glycine dehydrogenase subunit GcvPB [Deltaproteobacteria bacterium]